MTLARSIVDRSTYDRAVERFREQRIALPTFAELAAPASIAPERWAGSSPDDPDPRNLFRVHWHNHRSAFVDVPAHVVLPRALTGVDAPVVVLFGDRFPMIGAHKVLAAYACLAARVVTGQFDPTRQKAVWPSTGNYARGGVAISRIMGCRGVAVLPENMSAERFAWLDRWVADPGDVIRTPGSESNVREIYEVCAALAEEPDTVVFNQFSEFANHLAHWLVTGTAVERVAESLGIDRAAAWVSATGSAGTIAAGDRLKESLGARIVAVEALECPTMLYNGFGEHRIQGIGDKHVPLIHNVTNTDVVVAVSDRSTDALDLVWQSPEGHALLEKQGVPDDVIAGLRGFGLSSICNVLAAIKCAKHFGWGPDDPVFTVATDGARMYASERVKVGRELAGADFGALLGEHLRGIGTDHVRELDAVERNRIFNLGYFTWVEQQGVSVDAFEARREQAWWRDLRPLLGEWDGLIAEFNARTGVSEG